MKTTRINKLGKVYNKGNFKNVNGYFVFDPSDNTETGRVERDVVATSDDLESAIEDLEQEIADNPSCLVVNLDASGTVAFTQIHDFISKSKNVYGKKTYPKIGGGFITRYAKLIEQYDDDTYANKYYTLRGIWSNTCHDFKISESSTTETTTALVPEAPYDSKEYVRKNGAWAESSGGGGSSSPSTLFKTVADMQAASLNVGDVVETAGFYSVNDGGGAKYQIQSTGTANGMDLIAVAGNKIAKVLIVDSAYPEQLGYKRGDATIDVVPYFQRIVQLGVRKITLHASAQYYYMLQPYVMTSPDIEIVGGLGIFSGYSSNINYKSSSSVSITDECMFKIEHRRLKFKNVYLLNASNKAVPCFLSNTSNGNHEGSEFENVHISGFDVGFRLWGDTCWQYRFTRVNILACRLGFDLTHTFFMNYLNECYIAATEIGVYSKSEFNCVTFENCNFTCFNRCCLFEHRDFEQQPILFRLSDVQFICCSFEFDTPQTIPENTSGCFVKVNDLVEMKMKFDSCGFSIKKLRITNSSGVIQSEVKTTTCFAFGELTRVTFANCLGPNFVTFDLNKYLFDRTRPTLKKFGSLKIINCMNIDPRYDDQHLPCVDKCGGLIQFSSNTDLSKFVDIESIDGKQLFNLDDGCIYAWVAGQLQKISNNPQNIVRVGHHIYKFVTIGGRKWVTSNLKLWTTNSNILWNQARDFHEEYGCWYKYADITEISNQLPNGWRIPSQSDFDNLISSLSGTTAEKARALQSTNYPTIFTSATNSSGFSGVPSGAFGDGTVPNGAYYMGDTPNLALVLKNDRVLTYNYITDTPNLQPCLRICADA